MRWRSEANGSDWIWSNKVISRAALEVYSRGRVSHVGASEMKLSRHRLPFSHLYFRLLRTFTSKLTTPL